MDRREVCVSINESEISTKPSVVSASNRLQELIEEDLLQTSPAANGRILHKVPYMLRQVNEKAYVPRLISIGPYHHDTEHLKATEVIKRGHFRRMIEETKVEAKRIADAMTKEVETIRNYYEGPLNHISDDRFGRMLVLDGCFILQLFREKNNPQIEWIRQDDILYDLLLFENQLPFSVLLNLYSIIMNAGQQEIKREFYDLALDYFQGRVLNQNIPAFKGDINRYHADHLLSLVHDSWLHSRETSEEDKAKEEDKQVISCWPFQNQKSRSLTEDEGSRSLTEDEGSQKFISCATDLERTGINFKRKHIGTNRLPHSRRHTARKPSLAITVHYQNAENMIDLSTPILAKESKSLLDIVFVENAKELEIPRLVIDDNTESMLRNMMAYEQSILSLNRPTLVCNYVSFMDNLIDSGKDVQLLRKVGIIENWLGDDEVVAKMFNHLGDFINLSSNCRYEETVKMVNDHCKKKRHKWLAALKRDYFNSPWSFISVFAAVVLLALALTQTIYSVLSYVHRD